MFSLSKASTSVLFLLLCINLVLGIDVYAWGANNYGQLGLGNYIGSVPNITLIPTYQALSLESLVAGPNYHIATMTDGTVYACGLNFYGQLTLKTSVGSVNVPTPANSLNLLQNPPNLTLQIYATSGDAVGLSTSGNLYGWGSFAAFLKGRKGFLDVQWANPAQLTSFTGQVISTAVAYEATFFTTSNGNMYAAGINDNGRLGIGKDAENYTDITQMTFFTSNNLDVVIPSSSSDFVFAITPSDGHVYAWGLNANGQLGLGDTDDRNTPELITALTQYWHIMQILPAGNHTLALTCNGHVLAWGSNVYGQIGQFDTIMPFYATPQVVLGANNLNIVEIVTAENGNFIRTADNKWYVWGADASSVLGFGENMTDIYTPMENLNFEALGINHIVSASTGISAYGWHDKNASTSLNCPITLVNECLTNTCGSNAVCVDADIGYFCTCPHSYFPNPDATTLCSPIDYCSRNISYCDPTATCSYDAVTGTSCVCDNGFGNGHNRAYGGSGCTAFPSNCTAGFCTANAVCTIIDGRAYCNCSSGFSGDGYVNQIYRPADQPLQDACSDVNECAQTPSPCPTNSVCNNTLGSFYCTCDPGFTVVNSVSACVDDICNSNFSVCAAGSNCTADSSSQTCSCPDGYFGDGRSAAYGGTGCTVTAVNTTSGITGTVSSGSVQPSTESSTSGTTSGTTGGSTTGAGETVESTNLGDIYDEPLYTGFAGANPYKENQLANSNFAAELASNPSTQAPGHTPIQKARLGVVISIVGLLFIAAILLAIYVVRTRRNHLRVPIRYTNNPDNVVL